MSQDKEKWVSTEEVSEYLEIHKQTVRIWIAERNFPGVKIGKCWRFKLSEVDKWMKEQNNTYQKEHASE
jgi:excisionase family DNA binding protein